MGECKAWPGQASEMRLKVLSLHSGDSAKVCLSLAITCWPSATISLQDSGSGLPHGMWPYTNRNWAFGRCMYSISKCAQHRLLLLFSFNMITAE